MNSIDYMEEMGRGVLFAIEKELSKNWGKIISLILMNDIVVALIVKLTS